MDIRDGTEPAPTRGPGAALAVGVAVGFLATFVAAPAEADPSFGPHDVRTVFHIAKSDDHNRVDYGIRLDAECRPIGREPLYAYWHRFEPGEPRYGDLNMMDRQVYGIATQAVRTRAPGGSWTELRLNGFARLRILVLARRTEHGCDARARIPVNNRPAYVDRVFVQLDGPFGVESVTFRGIDADTLEPVSERRLPP